MEWISIKEKKPEHDQMCYVIDADWSMTTFIVIYHHTYDKFIQYAPHLRDHPSITVTHWIPLPSPFLSK